LEQCSFVAEEQNIGMQFLQMAPYFKMYSAYCEKSDLQYSTLAKARTRNAFNTFCKVFLKVQLQINIEFQRNNKEKQNLTSWILKVS
jgi:hypothetical protein